MNDLVFENKLPKIESTQKAKKENLKQRAYLNTLTSLIDFVGAQVTGLIVSPFIVGGLGSSMYGIWQILGQLTGYSKMADSRATQVLKWTIAKKKNIATEAELQTDLSSAFIVTLISMPIVLIIGSILSWYAPIITKAEPQYFTLIRVASSLLILSLVIARVFDIYECILRGMNLSFKRMGFRTLLIVLGGVLKVAAILLGYGILGLSVVQILITIITGLVIYSIVKKNVPWFGFGKTSYKEVVSFTKLSGWNMANTTAITLLGQSDKIFLGIIAGPVLVSTYTLTLFLPVAIGGIIFNIIVGAIPGIGTLIGLKEFGKIYKAWRSINDLVFLMAVGAGFTIILFNYSFLSIWVGSEHFAGYVANALVMVLVIQELFVKQDGYVITATLDLKKKVFITLVSITISFVLGLLLIKDYGIVGLCISLLVGRTFLFLSQRSIIEKQLKIDKVQSLLSFTQPFVVSILMLSSAFYFSYLINQTSFFILTFLVPSTFFSALVIFFSLGLSAERRLELIRLYSSIKLFKSKA